MLRRRALAPWAIATIVAVAAAGCGTRVADQTASQAQQQAPATVPVNVGNDPGSGAAFGSQPAPCGPNTTGGPLSSTGLGVTGNEIDVTTIADPGGPKPGLNQAVFDSMVAFSAWCNQLGGINGRKLKVSQKDAQILHYKDVMDAACADSFALVGGIGTFDDTGVPDYLKCGLVNVPASTVSPQASTAANTYAPLPFTPDGFPSGPPKWVKSTFPDAVGDAASLYSNISLAKYQADRQVAAYSQLGFTFTYTASANINETNWGPLVANMQGKGVKYMTLESSYEELIPLQKQMAQSGFTPDVTELKTNFYDTRYPQTATAQGADTSNTYVHLTVWPFEEAAQNPAMSQYLAELKKAVPDSSPAELGVQAWSAGLLFATAAKNAGPNLTRDTLVAELKKIKSWDGGGLHGTTDPADGTPPSCFIMMKVTDSGFERAYPLPDKDGPTYDNADHKGMACPADAIVTIKNPPNYG